MWTYPKQNYLDLPNGYSFPRFLMFKALTHNYFLLISIIHRKWKKTSVCITA